MTDQFKELTKNNGLKQVVWGSEEFVNRINAIKDHEQKVKEESERKKFVWDSGMALLEEVMPREKINL